MKTRHIIVTGLGALAIAACTHHAGWGVKGNIANVDGETQLAIEANNAGHWYVVDSVKVSSNGDFEYYSAAPIHGQDIYRLTLPGKGSVYFPIDSIDCVTVNASADNFGYGHTLAGSELAGSFGKVDSIVANTADMDELQHKLIEVITGDTTCLTSYYALGKSKGGKAIFDPNESLGNRAYGAVAQIYAMHNPLDPHAEAVRKAYFDGRRAMGRMPEEMQQYIEIPETGFFEIERYDARGNKCSLTELAKGKTVILNFTGYDLPNSPAINSMLNDLYGKYNQQGLEIYQISFDSDEVSWREAARNLPWTAVWNSPSDGSTVLANYNVGALPMFYIINKEGVLVERVETPADLPAKIAKYM